jgi:hypothetical protein
MTMNTTVRILCFAAIILLSTVPLFATATINIINVDGPEEGFNDPTPAAPVGGNPGTTIGQQRLNAFQYAADLWGAQLDSAVPISVQASFDPLACTSTTATLGAAGTIQVFANVPNVEFLNTWYHAALANKLAGVDLTPGAPGSTADDIVALFNVNLGKPGCLTGAGFYYGLDGNHGTQVDLVAVLLHEFGHGLGFANFVNEATGSRPLGFGDVFSQYTLDVSNGLLWSQMTTGEQLRTSAINTNKVVWSGRHANALGDSMLAFGTPLVTVNSPASLGFFRLGGAAFGPALTSPGVTGEVVVAIDPADGAGPSPTDGCSALTNEAAVAGNIALIDRGTCGFVVKVKHAQDAGAIAVLIADNTAANPPGGIAGIDPTITIPSVRIALRDGNLVRTALGSQTVNVTIGINATVQLGSEPGSGNVLLYAPDPVAVGSSISHWDPLAWPNLLMEPPINADLTHDLDLTLLLMADIGWFSDRDGVPDGCDECLGSSSDPTLIIGGCDSGAPNRTLASGCRFSDKIASCASAATTHEEFTACATQLSNGWKKSGLIDQKQKSAIQKCAGKAALP